jgi:hypothetical protein
MITRAAPRGQTLGEQGAKWAVVVLVNGSLSVYGQFSISTDMKVGSGSWSCWKAGGGSTGGCLC